MASIELADAREETLTKRILDGLAAEPMPLEGMLADLGKMRDKGYRTAFSDAAAMIEEALSGRADGAGLRQLFEVVAVDPADPVALRGRIRRVLGDAFKTSRLQMAMLDSAGLEADLSASECLRRLGVLMGLHEGTFCLDKTWGFGIVKRLDDFYKRVTVDFVRKSGHALSMAYAAETLQIVDEDHLLAMKAKRRPEMDELARSKPEEIIRIALRSFGALTVVQLQELLSGEKLDGGDWKSFWDRARKALKDDAHVSIPTKRSEPLRMLSVARSYGDSWFADLRKERDVKTILERLQELERVGEVAGLSAEGRAILAERAGFAVMGAEDRHPDLAARLLMAAARLELAKGTTFDLAAGVQTLADDARLPGCMTLPARELTTFLQLLTAHVPDAADRLVKHLPQLPVHAVHVVLGDLREAGIEERVSAIIRENFVVRNVSSGVLDYLCEHPQLLAEWRLGTVGDLLYLIVPALEAQVTLERYKTQKKLRERFEDRAWLEKMLAAMTVREREQLMIRIRSSRGWDEASKRSVLGRLIKLYPELQEIVTRAERKAEGPREVHFTSWRSYRERQEQLRVLVEVTIPENSREIGVARSYGDLRENFEYQAAKDQQRLLMRRQAELERDLGDVRGSDYEGVPSEVVGMGTGVRVQRPGGDVVTFWVLGEWDRDEAHGIISSRSEMAKRLEGARAGTEVRLPGEDEGPTSRVVEVLPLSDEIKAWVRGTA